MSVNPFDQFDTVTEKTQGQNPFDQFDEGEITKDTPTQERSFLGDTVSHLARGGVGLADTTIHALDTAVGGSQTLKRASDYLTNELPKQHPLLRPDQSEVAGEEGIVKRGWNSAMESTPQSAAVWGGALAGASAGGALGSAVPVIGTAAGALAGGIIGGAGSMVGLFGLGTYGKQKEEAAKKLTETRPDLDADQIDRIAHKNAMTHALAEVGGEGAGDIAAAIFFRTLPGGNALYKGGKEILKELAAPGVMKTLGKALAKDMPFEVGSEVGTSYFQNEADKAAGISTMSTGEAMRESIIPAIFLSTGMGVTLGGHAAYQRNQAYKALNDGTAEERADAAKQVAGVLAQSTDRQVAQTWLDTAMTYIGAGRPVPLDVHVADMAAYTPDAASAATPEGDAPKGPLSKAAEMLIGKTGLYGTAPAFVPVPTDDPRMAEEWANQTEQATVYNQGKNALGRTPEGRAGLMGNMPAGGVNPDGIDRVLNEASLERNAVGGPVTPENSLLARGEITPEMRRAEQGADYKDIFSGPSVLSETAEQRLGLLERKLQEGEVGQRFQKDDGDWDGVKSTNPEWLKSGPLKEVGKAGIATVIAKARNGSTMTNRQKNIWAEIKKAADYEWENDPATVQAREAEKIQAETGIQLDSPAPMPAGELNEGDKAVVLGKDGIPDVVTHKGWTEDGQVRLKDGVEIVVDPWEPIQTMGVQRMPESDRFEQRMQDYTKFGNTAQYAEAKNRPVQRATGVVSEEGGRGLSGDVGQSQKPAETPQAEVLPRDIGATRPAEITKDTEAYIQEQKDRKAFYQGRSANVQGDTQGFIRDQQLRNEGTGVVKESLTAQPKRTIKQVLAERKQERNNLDVSAHEAATSPGNEKPEPTQAQKEAGNYAMGHVNLHGMDISIENPQGSERKGVDPQGKPWSVTMKHHYGYIRGTIGPDKDHVDVFIGPRQDSEKVFVVDQVDPKTGKFDEPKVVMGANSKLDAKRIYLSNYEKRWKGAGDITEMSLDQFKAWAFDKKTSVKPAAKFSVSQNAKNEAQGDLSLTGEPQATPKTTSKAGDTKGDISNQAKTSNNVEESTTRGDIRGDISNASKADSPRAETVTAPVEAEASKKDVPENDFGNIKNEASQAKENAATLTKPTVKGSIAAQPAAPTVKESLTVQEAPPRSGNATVQNTRTGAEGEQADKFAGNKVFTADKVAAARERLKAKRSSLSSGFDPELMQDLLVIGGAHFEAGVRNFSSWAKAVMADIGAEFKPFLRGTYENLRHYPGIEKDGMSTATDTDAINLDEIPAEPDNTGKEQTQEENNVAQLDSNTDLERDSQDAGTQDGVGKEGIRDGSRRAGATGESGVRGASQKDRAGDSKVDSGPETATAGERGDQSPYSTNGESVSAESDAGSDNDRRGGDAGDGGQQPDRIAAETVRATAQKGSERQSKVEAQRKSAKIKTIKGDLANIQETLPLLKPGQQTDVLFAEQRFSKPDGHGVLFTNGTGTGKTFSALGIIKRFERDGKKNILIIAPDNVIIDAWAKAAKSFFDIDLHKLEDTKRNGRGITVTTYANFRDNQTLAKRNWDLIVADESHELNMNKDGKATASQNMFQAVSLHPRGAYDRAKLIHSDLWQRVEDLSTELRLANTSDNQQDWDRIPGLEKKLSVAHEAWKEKLEEVKAQIATAQKDGTRPKVVFLSATPFAYEKNIDYAEGYLFDYESIVDDQGYNSGGAFERFMMQHFGYRMRYNKLTEPEKEVNRGLMQRQFNSWLKKEGVLSSRVLDVDYDYDRRFVLVESAVGQKIDEGLQYLYDEKRFAPLWQKIREQFDYLTRRYLLEAIKANEIIPVIKGHLAQGRKVVVFHDYIKGGATNPFDLRHLLNSGEEVAVDGGDLVKLGDLVQEFITARPDLANLPIKNLPSPLATLTNAFPDLMVVNGQTVKPAQAQANINAFNDDDTGPAVLMVQSDKDKGWSGHDTTGKHQRVLINLGLPTRPTRAIQQEGRIYRVGQASDAIIRYVNTGTNWERWAFASTIAQRASAAENLAMGEEARALQDSFIQAFEESDAYPPGFEGEGKGGKERDATSNAALSEWDRATALYYSNQKKTSRTKAEEGKDYFATPEPLGLKMVEWANIKGGDDVLEPSAGHGAIARWFPENTMRTVVEPSSALASRLKMVTADAKLIQDQFENLSIVNKYDAIVMNPPFGTAGKTAMDHIEKAYKHLRDGGRIVALIPSGPSMDKRLDKFLYATDAKGKSVNPDIHLVAEFMLPSTTFERAGTSVNARVVVLDKIEDNEMAGKIRQQSARDYSGDYPVKEFFDRIENSSVPERINIKQEEDAKAAGVLEAYGVQVVANDDAKFPFKVTGKTYPYRNLIKNLVDAKSRKWDGDQKAWIFKEDPTALLAEELADEPKYSVADNDATPTTTSSTPDTVKAEISATLGRFRTMQLMRKGVLNIVASQEEAKRIVKDAGAKLSAAWHGSPHDFEQFRMSAIGTGEGAQAYGFGLYFAGAKEVAEWYKSKLSGGYKVLFDGKDATYMADWDDRQQDHIDAALRSLRSTGSIEKASAQLDRMIALSEKTGDEEGKSEWISAKIWLDDNKGRIDVKSEGRLYQVELAPQEDEYLIWDRPLSEQSEKVKAALENVPRDVLLSIESSGGDGAALYRKLGKSIGNKGIMKHMMQLVNDGKIKLTGSGEQKASEYLHSLGIRGIKYLDGTSRGKGEGAFNYVIFDENDITVQAKYSKSGAIQGFALNGKTYLVSDGIPAGETFQVFLHEMAHLTRLGFSDGQFNQILNTIERHKGKGTLLGKAIAEAEARIPEDTPREYRNEEVLAYLIENDKTNVGIMRRFIAMVKAALVKMGISPNIFKAEDFKALAVNAAKWQSTVAAGSNAMLSVREMFKPVDPNSPALKRFLGNSQITEPVYHGSPKEFWTFDKNRVGQKAASPGAGLGFFFATDKTESAGYAGPGGLLRSFYVKAENPKRMNASELPKFRSVDEAQAYAKRQQLAGYDSIILEDEGHVIVFEPNQVKSAEINTGEFDADNPDVRYSVAGGLTGNGTGPVWQTPQDSKRDTFLYNVQDKLIDLKRIQDNIEQALGPISEEHDVRMAEELYHKRAAKRTEDMLISEVNPLMKELGEIQGGDLSEFEEYMHALHAPEANESLRLRNPNEDELAALKEQAKADRDRLQESAVVQRFIDKEREMATAERDVETGDADDSLLLVVRKELESLREEPVVEQYIKARERHLKIRHAKPFVGDNTALSGMSNEDAEQALAKLPVERMNQYQALTKKWQRFIAKTRETLVQYELEGRETVDAWAEAFKYYVPLHREDMDNGMGIGQGFSVKGSSTRARTGSNRKVVDILAHVVMQREKAIVRGEKAAISKALYGLAAANPNPDVWTIETPPMVREFDPVTGLVISRPDPGYKNKPNAVVHRFVNEKGHIEERAVLFNERSERGMRLAEALKNLDVEQLGAILRTSAILTRWFSAVNTQYNLVFGPVNAIRDAGSALLNLTNTPLSGRQKQVAKRIATSIGPLFKAIWADAKGQPLNTEIGKAWREMQLEGGTTGFRDMFENADARANDLKRAMLSTATSKAAARFNWVKQQVSLYNDVMENASRLAVYMEARSQGLSRKRAASLAKNITLNFNRKGKVATQAGAMYAFFNAAVQGTEKLYRTLRGPAGKKILAGGLLLGASQAVLLAAAGFGDDEPKDFIKERSLIVPIGNKKYVTIPMPLGFNVIPNLARVATEWALSGGKRTGERVTSILSSFAETFNPVGNAGFSVQTIAPTAIDPLIALGENKDWTGRNIALPNFNPLKPTPGHSRMKDTASIVGIGLSRALNLLTGGNEYTPGLLSLTPDQIDYLIGQALGGVGRESLKAMQTVGSAFTGEELPTYKIPLVSRFYGDSADSSATSTAFYRNIKRLNMHAAEVEGLRENRGDVRQYMTNNPEARLIGRAAATYRRVQKLQKVRRDLLRKGGEKARVEHVEARIKATMDSLNKVIR